MAERMRLLNLKVPDDLRALIERAAEVSEMPDMSKWAREALEAGARAEIAAHERRESVGPNHPPSPSTDDHDAAPASRSRCTHPTPARMQQVTMEVCGLCGVMTRWKM